MDNEDELRIKANEDRLYRAGGGQQQHPVDNDNGHQHKKDKRKHKDKKKCIIF
jgi:hypothetical protein